ncbi:MAG: cellulase family glycosylhydrolase [Oscillospiraceae bacterium]|nr:cellulase family glycosylhydrolase [Oscillospiraceae bacterium]
MPVFSYDFAGKATATALPTPTAQKLPLWRGFNLLNFFNTLRYRPFDEEIFEIIAAFGFNFVRLPIDYRCMITGGDWFALDEGALEQLDRAVEFGIKHDIHICLNLHRAPGYTVASPPEATDLWRQREPAEAFEHMWGALARRYSGVPNEYLSFNLVNEPPDIDETVYARVMGRAAGAIWEHSPNRLIIADGLSYGAKPSYMIMELGMAQATRGYQPFNLTHYKAEWVSGADRYPAPAWPDIMIPMYLYGYAKSDIRTIYDIDVGSAFAGTGAESEAGGEVGVEAGGEDGARGEDEVGAGAGVEAGAGGAYRLDINVGIVSDRARLVVKADGQTLFSKLLVSGAGEGEWKTEVYAAEWNIYQNIFDRDYSVDIPGGVGRVTVEVEAGDWISVNYLRFSLPVSEGEGEEEGEGESGGGVSVGGVSLGGVGSMDGGGGGIDGGGTGRVEITITPNNADWGAAIPPMVISADGQVSAAVGASAAGGEPSANGAGMTQNRQWLRETYIKPWEDLMAAGGGVMVGEWGAYNKTPNDVVLAWMEDCLANYSEVGLGWALWNFDDAFGIINSNRADVEYEVYGRYRLDRKMLELLQGYDR